jgi:CrcB protein
MQLELLRMLDGGHIALALSYAVTSIVLGFFAVVLATNLVRRTPVTA